MKKNRRIVSFLCFALVCSVGFSGAAFAQSANPAPAERALLYLKSRMDDVAENLYVYRNFAADENRFVAKGLFSSAGQSDLVYPMDENWTVNPASGDSCIRCRVRIGSGNWGGWMFINGMLKEGEMVPVPVWGDVDGCAMDLSGATALTFMARGEKGGERVEFFMGGLGRSGETGIPETEYPDSTAKISTGVVTLTDTWEQYVIDLSDADLTSIGCGFGFAVAGDWNIPAADGGVSFFLDDVRYEGAAVFADTPRFIASYETDNLYLRNAAFSYDNALCALAFIAAGEKERSRLILDAFVGAIQNDRYAPNRVRNAYVYGDPSGFPGWGGATRLPGFYLDGVFCEDRYQAGSNLGNTSFVALALLNFYVRYGGDVYLETARTIVDYARSAWADPAGDGFFAGYDGWPENGTVYTFTYKSTEHNIDFYAACTALYRITGDEAYREAAQSALRFLSGMYDAEAGLFWTGTTEDGVTPNTGNIVLDVQVWSALALGGEAAPYTASISYATENFRTPGGGYAFSQGYRDGGYWLEGTAFTALALRQSDRNEDADAALAAVEAAQLPSGGLPAVAGAETLDTGFLLFTGEPWLYGTDPHIAPVAWYIMATLNFNPYGVGER